MSAAAAELWYASPMTRRRSRPEPKPVIGWREWIELPDLNGARIKAKIDTGARTSALHAFALSVDEVEDRHVAVFEVHPEQRSAEPSIPVTHEIDSFRQVRSSNGVIESRPVIVTTARLGGVEWPIEVTLTSRDEMGFRMLLGRAAVRRRFVVDPGRSFVLSDNPPPMKSARKKKPTT